MLHRLTSLAAISMLCLTGAATAAEPAKQPAPQQDAKAAEPKFSPEAIEYFEKEVRPLLVARCQECHGAGKELEGGLRLLSRANVLKGGDSGPAAKPNDPKASLLIRAVKYDGLNMPPDKKLPAVDIARLEKWVELGLPWPAEKAPAETAPAPATPEVAGHKPPPARSPGKEFWAFQPVKDVPLPAVKNTAWPAGPIDRYVLARIEAAGLTPAAAADKRALIRRATFDLTGLPPTPADVAAFLADDSPDAFAKVVDRLLASPQYGERWGRHWLDVVRYTDSFDARGVGNGGDVAAAWRYRDWVVDALNRDMPYDRFVIDQIAGDLQPTAASLANPTLAEKHAGIIATGMLSIGDWGGGDADKEKLLTDVVDDQINVVTRGFLGLTVACARCHDHKFDPISIEDYYGLAGIFFSSHILPDVGPKTGGPPMMRIPLETPEFIASRDAFREKLKAAEQALQASVDKHTRAFAQAKLSETAKYLAAAAEFRKEAGKQGVKLADFATQRQLAPFALAAWVDRLAGYKLLDTPHADIHGKPGVHSWNSAAGDCPNMLVNTTPAEVQILTFKLPPKSVALHPGPQSGVVLEWQCPLDGTVKLAGRIADADPVGGDGVRFAIDHRPADPAAGIREVIVGDLDNGGARDFTVAGETKVAKGDRLYLAILPRREYTCDTTVVQLNITASDGTVWDLTRDVLAGVQPRQGQTMAGNPSGLWTAFDMTTTKRGADDPRRIALPAAWQQALLAYETGATDAAALLAAATEVQKSIEAKAADWADAKNPFWIADVKDRQHLPAEAKVEIDKLTKELEELKKKAPEAPFAHGAKEGGVPGSPHAGIHDVRVHKRGRYDRLGDVVPRRFLTVMAGAEQPAITQGSGRLQLAQWIASPENTLTARVMVNRVWQQHFGAALVRTPGNFGWLGERPTHPELLDYLARRLVEQGWSLKSLHREILLSATWRQSSAATPESVTKDPDNRLFARMNRRRLDAESLRDGLLAAAGKLDLARGGLATRDLNSTRRTLYVMTIRSDRATYRSLFDGADPGLVVDERTNSTVAPQALFVLNHPFAIAQAKALADRTRGLAGDSRAKVTELYQTLYARPPRDAELRLGQAALDGAAGALSVEDYCHVLLCANEFIYVD